MNIISPTIKKSLSSGKIFVENFVFRLKRYSESEIHIHTFVLATGVFSLMLVYLLQRSYNPFVHDSAYYWSIANSFTGGESFSIINFTNDLRGYFFPFLLFLLKSLAGLIQVEDKILFYVFSAFFFTFLSVYIIPWFTSTVIGWKTHLLGRGGISLLLFFFWRGYFLYPLSDFPAFAALLIGVTLFTKSLRTPGKYLPAFASFFLAAALNIRPVYLVSLLILFVLGIIFLMKNNKRIIAQWLLAFILGGSIVLLPQYQINRTHLQKNSPLVQARYAGENLYVKELFWGLGTQKFETNIGDNFPSITLVYADPFKEKLRKTNLLKDKTLSGYIKIARRFPVDMAISYFKHLFNGLDMFFSTPYIKNIYANHMFLSTVNYLLWLLVIYHVMNMDLSHVSYFSTAGVVTLLSPVVLAIPIALEIRYFLPAYVIAYIIIAFGPGPKILLQSIRRNKWNLIRIAAVCIVWLLLCLTISSMTAATLIS